MKGLFIKDWRLMTRQIKLMLVFVLVFVGMFSFTMEDSYSLSGMYSVVFLMLSINCFAYDETSHFDKLIAASPISKSRVVLARYAAALAVDALGMVVIAAVHGGIRLFQGKPMAEIGGDLSLIAACSFVGILFISIVFPIFYRFGVNKSRIIMVIFFGAMAALVGMGTTFLKRSDTALRLSPVFLRSLPFLLIAMVLLGLWLSISISARILENKEY